MKKILHSFVMPALLLLLTQSIFAQTRTVTGRVTDKTDGSGLPNVTVLVKGSTTGTQTDNEGNFSLSVPESATTLVISTVGYNPQEVTIGAGPINVEMENSSSANLNEVVVVGYGTARRRDVTGATASVRARDFNKGVQVAPDQLIQGKAAGVMVINNSGQPGGATTVRIRGTSSIRSGNQPLFVVDGVQLPSGSARPGGGGSGIGTTPGGNPLNYMNPADIASVEILKDASATAIYGSRGANGVILITTKRGQTGTPSIEAGAAYGISTIMKRLEVLSATEYRQALQDYNLGSAGDFGGDVDAMDEILRVAPTTNLNASVGGGNENGRYRLSLSALNQQGIVKESGFEKYTAGLNTSYKLLENKKLSLDFNVLVSQTNEDIAPISNDAGFTGSLIGQALQWNPTHPLRKPADSFPAGSTRPIYGDIWVNNRIGATTVNPLAMLAAHSDRINMTTILASVSPSYKISNELEYRFLYSINRSMGVRRTQISRWLNIQGLQDRGGAEINNSEETTQQFTNTLSYNKQVSSDLNLNVVVGHEYLKFENQGNGTFALDFVDVGLSYFNFMQYSTQNTRGIYSYASPTSDLQSFFGRAIANYKDKYLLTATYRADGSSRFGRNNRYGYFPSLAFAWNLSNEDFLQGSSVFNNLKLRLGWGQVGNQDFAFGVSRNRIVFGQQSFSQVNFENPNVKWETSSTTNVGVDFSVFGDRLFGSVDYFYKKTTDPLFERVLVQPGPVGRQWVNLGGFVVNSGVEIALTGNVIRKKDMNWDITGNISFLDNKVDGLFPAEFYETGALHGQGISGATSQRIVNNQPLNAFYLRRFQGLDKTTGQSIYEDEGNTLYYVGSPNPTMLLGFSSQFEYKRFSATVAFNGTFGHYLYNNTLNTALPIGNLGTRNIAKSLVEGPDREDPSNAIAPSTRYLENGNYVKMQNASINYRVGNIGNTIKNLTISLTGQNLFVITKFTGFDPEVNTDKSVNGIPSLGIEYTPYPSARTILLGVNFTL